MVRRGHIQILKTPVQLRLKLFPKVYDGEVGHSPEGEVAGIVLPVAGDILVFAALFRDLEKLPRRPGIAVPDKFQKAVALDQGAGIFAVQHPADISRQFQILWALLHQLPRQRVKQPQPGKIVFQRDLNNLFRKDYNEAFRSFHFCIPTRFCYVLKLPIFRKTCASNNTSIHSALPFAKLSSP